MVTWKKDIIIVDEDLIAGNLTKNLLIDGGLSAYLINKPFDTLTILRKYKPKAVILDAVFSQISGLKLCRLIRSDKSLNNVKIIFVTQKAFDYEKQEAFKLGADGFIKKPYNVEVFAKQVYGIMTDKNKDIEIEISNEDAQFDSYDEVPSSLNHKDVHATVWGMREIDGLLLADRSEYGAQTPCVCVETAEKTLVFHAGTGIINFGENLMQNNGHKDLWVFLSNFHFSHILGFPYFPCVNNQNFTLRIMAALESEKRFKSAVEDIFFASPFWSHKPAKAKLLMYEAAETTYEISEDINVSAIFVNHPGLTLAYKIEAKGKTIVYAPCNEILGNASALENSDEKFMEFAKDADLLIHDCYFNDADYEVNKGKGHSCVSNIAEFAAEQARVKKCVLFASNPYYTDEVIEKMLTKTRRKASDRNWNTKFYVAKEGFKVKM